ncbi:BMA-ZFH-2, isoform f [Dirofilaria immitis]|nr:BMA-ZFH-2, isoform f [Dirofilaria immitis]
MKPHIAVRIATSLPVSFFPFQVKFSTLETKTEFSEHRRVVHSSKTNDESTMAELCPLCPCKYIELRTHLTEEHKIAEEAIERLLLNTAPSSLLSDSAFNKR